MKKHRKTVAPPVNFQDIIRRISKLEPKLDKPPKLPGEDTKRLRTLVRKYGRDRIQRIVSTIDLTAQRGRPPLSDERWNRMSFAGWIERKAEELRQAGSKSPIKAAFYAAYELAVGELKEMERRHPGHFNRWVKTHERIRREGKRYLHELRMLAMLADGRRRRAHKIPIE
jgi:hypothetical protein